MRGEITLTRKNVRALDERVEKVETSVNRLATSLEPLEPVREIFSDIGRVYPVVKRWGRRGKKLIIFAGSIGAAVWGIFQGGKVVGWWA